MIKKSSCILFVIIVLNISQNSFSIMAQENENIFPLFDVYGSASYSSGLGLGVRVQVSEHFSVESAFGPDIAYYLAPSDLNYRYSVGINWHKGYDSKLIVNLTYVKFIYPPEYTSSGYAISLNVGSLTLIEEGFHFFYSGGIWIKKEENVDYTYVLPNFEIGVGWRF
jgi:hypothetical protein